MRRIKISRFANASLFFILTFSQIIIVSWISISQIELENSIKIFGFFISINPFANFQFTALLVLLTAGLQIFLLASNPEFLALCRKIVTHFFEKAKVKISSISLNKSEFADILSEVHTKHWEDIVLFRFIRTTGTVGELIVRDLYASCKEHKADRGYCIIAGDYSDSAKQFVEARLIDLIDKNQIKQLFKRINIGNKEHRLS